MRSPEPLPPVRNSALPPTIYADLGDNCGAGGPANTLWMLEAMHQAGARGVLIAGFCDSMLVADAVAAGPGGRFDATFAGDGWQREGRDSYAASAKVISLHDGHVVGRHGIVAGKSIHAGRMARLRLDELEVIVTERRTQFNDPVFLEALGVDIRLLRGLVVKLRATFRAAFDQYFRLEDMLMVDTPGRTTPMLHRLPFRHLPRPVLPLDKNVQWSNPLA